MNFSAQGEAFTKGWEVLVLHAYLDEGGVWTIGYGHAGKDVYEGLIWTEDQAESAFVHDVAGPIALVNHEVPQPLTQGQFDALVDFVFNVGAGNFLQSTLLRLLKLDRYEDAYAQFPVWNKVRIDGSLVVSQNLVRRRAAEQVIYKQI